MFQTKPLPSSVMTSNEWLNYIRTRGQQSASNDEWPKEYRNASSGKIYLPHTDADREVVYTDGPRYVLIKGGEGCVAADTLIEGVPVADRAHAGMITTLYGPGV